MADEEAFVPLKLDDSFYRSTMGDRAYALAGAGFDKATVLDLEEKLEIFRAIAGLTHSEWPDAALARFVMGDDGDGFGPAFNRKKLGKVALTARDGAMLAQLLNALAAQAPEARAHYAPGTHDGWITSHMANTHPGNAGFTAPDLQRSLLEFAGRAAVLIEGAQEGASLETAHVRLMAMLNGLSAHSDAARPVVFCGRQGEGQASERFGDEQVMPLRRVWDWEPLPLQPEQQLYATLDFELAPPCEIWAVTVRDPRPSSPYGASGSYCWEEDWDRLVRWTVPGGPIEKAGPPRIAFGKVARLRGLYSLFVLVDRSASGMVRDAIGGDFGKPVSVDGLFGLLRAAGRPNGLAGVDCFVRRYRIETP
ncbi:hypothetical protein [Sphingomonas sp. KR3-1]|uniref:hypothetical protein n=1 Tax=Sphingomonas sp. KR3-1 TaxID=3156611 RepID=UPI0032B588CE